MNLSAPFIARPVATTLLTIGVALAGIAGFFQLPVALHGAFAQLPAAVVNGLAQRFLRRIEIIEEIDRSVFKTLIDRKKHQRPVCGTVFVHQPMKARALSGRQIHVVERWATDCSCCGAHACALRPGAQPRL